jgi:hypothetical protein
MRTICAMLRAIDGNAIEFLAVTLASRAIELIAEGEFAPPCCESKDVGDLPEIVSA